MRAGLAILQLSLAMAWGTASAQSAASHAWPADGYATPLTHQPGDPVRGRRLVLDRQQGFCLLCHSGPFPEERFQGTLGPDLSVNAGQRLEAHVRARLLAPTLFNPDSLMPAYGPPTSPGLRVHPQFQGKPLLQPQDIEDIVAFVMQMKP